MLGNPVQYVGIIAQHAFRHPGIHGRLEFDVEERTASVGSIDHREMINPALPGGREIGFQNRQAAFATDGLQECATANIVLAFLRSR